MNGIFFQALSVLLGAGVIHRSTLVLKRLQGVQFFLAVYICYTVGRVVDYLEQILHNGSKKLCAAAYQVLTPYLLVDLLMSTGYTTRA